MPSAFPWSDAKGWLDDSHPVSFIFDCCVIDTHVRKSLSKSVTVCVYDSWQIPDDRCPFPLSKSPWHLLLLIRSHFLHLLFFHPCFPSKRRNEPTSIEQESPFLKTHSLDLMQRTILFLTSWRVHVRFLLQYTWIITMSPPSLIRLKCTCKSSRSFLQNFTNSLFVLSSFLTKSCPHQVVSGRLKLSLSWNYRPFSVCYTWSSVNEESSTSTHLLNQLIVTSLQKCRLWRKSCPTGLQDLSMSIAREHPLTGEEWNWCSRPKMEFESSNMSSKLCKTTHSSRGLLGKNRPEMKSAKRLSREWRRSSSTTSWRKNSSSETPILVLPLPSQQDSMTGLSQRRSFSPTSTSSETSGLEDPKNRTTSLKMSRSSMPWDALL